MIQTHFICDGAAQFLPKNLYETENARVQKCWHQLTGQTGKGNDFLGWLELPETMEMQLPKIKEVAQRLAGCSEVVVVIGIGGSYLGARAVIEALQSHFRMLENDRKSPIVLFAGNNMSEDYLFDLKNILDKKFPNLARRQNPLSPSVFSRSIAKRNMGKLKPASASSPSQTRHVAH